MHPNHQAEMVRLQNVSKTYRSAAGQNPVVQDVSLSVRRGEFVGIFGKSGSGKTTLLHLITGIDSASEGEVWIDGAPYHTYGEEKLTTSRARDIGVVFQFFQLLPMLTAVENVMLPMEFLPDLPTRKRRARAMELLEKVGIHDCADRFPEQLSGGQQQRVAIARALANDPKMIVADEPTGNLDSGAASTVLGVFRDLIAMGKTVLIVTHDRSIEKEFSRVIHIVDGRILEGTEGSV